MIVGQVSDGGLSMARVPIRDAGSAARHTIVIAFVFVLMLAVSVHTVSAWEAADATAADIDDDSAPKDSKKEKKKTARSARFLPIPIFITEPAIGVGLGAALAYFHKKKGAAGEEASIPRATTAAATTETGKKTKPPPTVSAVAGAYTESGTWGAGIGHSRANRKDSVRYVGAVGYAKVKSTIFRLNIPFDFDIEGGILYQDIRFRLGQGNFFLGAKLSALSAKATVELGFDRPLELGEGETSNVGLAAQAIWETRDNVMTPNSGRLIQLDVWRYDDAIGGDFDYWDANFKINSFHQLHDRFVLGWRIDARAIDGKPPFWGYPWVTLRGVPALRYQNERVGVAEVEGRLNLAKRWAVVGFIGAGATAGDIPLFEAEDNISAGGIGGRFLFLPDEDLWVGVDIARGPEDFYWYIQVGQAW
jgi:hypothetical protein